MEPIAGAVKVTERVRLLVWDDKTLGRPVAVSLVIPGEIRSLSDLLGRLDVDDFLEVVRLADSKLPREGRTQERAIEPGPGSAVREKEDTFEIPPTLRNKRFVFPSSLFVGVRRELFTKGGFGVIKGYMLGKGEGGPFEKLGVLGRARVEEHMRFSSQPYFLASLLQAIRLLADEIYVKMGTPAKVRTTLFDLGDQFRAWIDRSVENVARGPAVRRLLRNPLAPFALRRASPPPSVESLARYILEGENPYGLSAPLAGVLDARFDGELPLLLDQPDVAKRVLERIKESEDAWRRRLAYDRQEKRYRSRLIWIVGLVALTVPCVSFCSWFLGDLKWAAVLGRLESRELVTRVLDALAAGVLSAGVPAIAGAVWLLWRRCISPVCRRWRREASMLARHPETAGYLPHAEWKKGIARLRAYGKFKADCLDYHALSGMSLPPLDNAQLYTEAELRAKWAQNAAVCFEDAYPTLVVGAATRASVYMIDVVGSTELSSSQTLSNALELYGRMLEVANESGKAPIWRKEVGDGRIYCHLPLDALRRAILSSQGAAHHKVGLGIGIGLSVGEIYRDVRSGDFLNEVTNRAARLNSRDDSVAEYLRARYTFHPHRVHVKWGRVWNAGIALDDRAVAELCGSGFDAEEAGTPLHLEFPIAGVTADERPGTVSFFVERMNDAGLRELFDVVGGASAFGPRLRSGEALAFEVFCRKSDPGLEYTSGLEGDAPEKYLEDRGVLNPVYAARVVHRDLAVNRAEVTLPTGETVNLVLKPEKAILRGLPPTPIAEVEVPSIMLRDEGADLPGFLSTI